MLTRLAPVFDPAEFFPRWIMFPFWMDSQVAALPQQIMLFAATMMFLLRTLFYSP